MPKKPRRKVGNPLALVVMALLLERPMHPYEMAKTMRQREKDKSIKINYGTLYMVVNKLVDADFIVARETTREAARPARTVYDLTDAGRDELEDWMRELVRTPPEQEFLQYEGALALLGVLSPAEVPALLAERIEALRQKADELRRQIPEVIETYQLDEFFLIEDEYRLALVEAEWKFTRDLHRRITEKATDFGRDWRRQHRAGAGKKPAKPRRSHGATNGATQKETGETP